VFALDQLVKWWVTGPLGVDHEGAIYYILPIFQFTYTENIGISLGALKATTEISRWMLVGLTTAIAVGVAFWMTREKNRIDQIALGMVLGGALGNILDRTRHGYVVDFADLHFGTVRPFLIFNVGDAAISIAVVILLLRAFLSRKDEAKGSGPEETIEHA
jgi:signal peptidase II